ncbi:carboxylesterase/lipase family protein [Microtetraspora fusca]|uniref:Carboxylic ester hydrolase n=1 Tax=Microtetraspora fusca TaxID=1997 RepID=A0ABW6VH10_MICFU
MTVVHSPAGAWRGTRREKVSVFRGIRYAEAARFGPPRRLPPHTGVADAVRPGDIAPQSPSRLEGVMGAAAPLPQSEDCLRLTVTTPDPRPSAARPVLVWMHGGAYLTGSGEWNLYDAERLSAEGDIVVVSVAYRLGALGYLCVPGLSDGNLGLLDQIAALGWVHDSIAAFGGDPGRVTVAGQSAGAHSAAAMLGIDDASRLFGRAVLQSAPLGLGFASPGDAERVGALFLRHLGADPLRAPVADILAAQARTARELAGPLGLGSAPPFLPVAGSRPLPAPAAWRASVVRRAKAGLDVMLGTTDDEMTAFYGRHPVFTALRRVPLAGDAIADRIQRAVQDRVFERPTRRLADLLAGSGANVYRYQVRRFHPGGPFGACHCIELPLLFGDGDAWRDAPMLAGIAPETLASAGARTRALWSAFARSGVPDGSRWRRHTPRSRHARALP